MNLRHCLLALAAFTAAPSFACVSYPQTIELVGTSFGAKTNFRFNGNCGAQVLLSLKSDDLAVTERSEKYSAEMTEWRKKNPQPDFMDEAKYNAHSDKMKAFAAEVGKKYPVVKPALDIELTSKDGKMCFGDSAKVCKAPKNMTLRDDQGKTIGFLEANEKSAILRSVNEKGEKDRSKPAVLITPKDSESLVVEAYEEGQLVGNLKIDGEMCSRGEPPPGKGTLPLKGKSYSSGGGCGDGLLDKNFDKATQKPSDPGAAAEGFKG